MPGFTMSFPLRPGVAASMEDRLRTMEGYMFRLTEQLQYLFNNLGTENLTEEAVGRLAAAGGEAAGAMLEGRLSGLQNAGQVEAAVAGAVGGLEGRVEALEALEAGISEALGKLEERVEALEAGAYSTTPLRIGRYKNTAYSVYKVVVPIAGTSSGSASFTAPAYVQRIVSIKGSGYNGTYWLPLPYVFTSLVNQATLRCEVYGASCTVNLVTGSNQSFVNGTVEAVVEFVC